MKAERQRVELRFTFNLLTLTRFVAIDANSDQRIDKAELEAAEPALRDYLNRQIQVRINDGPAALGEPAGFECVWPAGDGQQPHAAAADYPQRYVDLLFRQDVHPVLADIWLGFDIWQHTGPLGTVEATYEQDDLRMQVPFSLGEPDYLYDTGYAVEGLFQEPKAATPAAKDGTSTTAGIGTLAAAALILIAVWLVRRVKAVGRVWL